MKVFKIGAVQVAVFKNNGPYGGFHSIQASRSYKEHGVWKSNTTFDLPTAVLLREALDQSIRFMSGAGDGEKRAPAPVATTPVASPNRQTPMYQDDDEPYTDVGDSYPPAMAASPEPGFPSSDMDVGQGGDVPF